MKKLLKPRFYLAPTLVAALALSACSSEDGDGGSSEPSGTDGNAGETETIENEDGLYSIDDFESTKANEGEDIGGGTLNVGLVANSEFAGVLNWQFYNDAYDGEVLNFFGGELFHFDEAFNYVDGAASLDFSEDGLTITVTIRDDVNWHDGEPVTAEDYAYAFEVIAHPDYTGVRYNSSMQIIEGIQDYHAGDADNISGLNIVDEKTVEIRLTDASPATLAGGLWSYPMAKHIYEDIPVSEMESADETRVNPIGFGPFKVESIVPGESVTYTAYEDYWEGAPLLDGVQLQVVNPDIVIQSLGSGDIDLALSFPATQFADNAGMTNLDWVARIDRGYSYTGFKLGKWEDGENVPDPDMKMADVELRRAIAHAVDYDALGEQMYNGLRYSANTIIPPYHALYHDETLEGFEYDPDLANQILDDAGYEYDGDWRTTPDGEELTITYAAMEGDATSEAVTEYQMQGWRDIGLNVQLLEGRTHEFNSFYDRVEEDDPDIDMYGAAWSMGANADPSGVWGPVSPSNYTRYTDDTAKDILERGVSLEAFELEYRQDVYNEWQEYFQEVIPAIPTQYRIAPTPMNKRVNGYTIEVGNNDYGYHTIYLSEEEPLVNGQ